MNYLALIAGVFMAVAASLPVYAQPAGRDQPHRFERPQQREFRRDEDLQRRQEERSENREARQGRLTPEERQQLRRDIREHGRDVYRDRPRRF